MFRYFITEIKSEQGEFDGIIGTVRKIDFIYLVTNTLQSKRGGIDNY